MVPWGTGDPISSGDLNTLVFLTEKPPPLSVSIGGGSMSHCLDRSPLQFVYIASEKQTGRIEVSGDLKFVSLQERIDILS